jgi:galactofuranosylgalactofuranosylrhamnosyl-N-acetylglucosaminyl-diphospho-decaprenol beta-1,5/1,6-galactofuranosyltransferase
MSNSILQNVIFPKTFSTDSYFVYFNNKNKDKKWLKEAIISEQKIILPRKTYLSFASYFNAFPIKYWLSFTSITSINLELYSNQNCNLKIFGTKLDENENIIRKELLSKRIQKSDNIIELPINSIESYSWIYFDIATKDETTLENIKWTTSSKNSKRTTVNLAITTLNKPEYVMQNLKTFASEIRKDDSFIVNKIIVVDQGNKKVQDHEDYKKIKNELQDSLCIINQSNLGGSGGFSRGMLQTITNYKNLNTKADYLIISDDDVLVDFESFRRAKHFADFGKEDNIIGGHMFWKGNPSVINSYAEDINKRTFRWFSLAPKIKGYDFSKSNINKTKWIQKKYDVSYNGWWFSLIPSKIIKEIQLAYPFFIKWDDVEFSLRASKYGYKTVSLPGVFVWHDNWGQKDDTIDWQAFFHLRNRLIVWAIYSDPKYSISFLFHCLLSFMKSLATMRYSVLQQQIEAQNNFLSNPIELKTDLTTRLEKIKELRKTFTDSCPLESKYQGYKPKYIFKSTDRRWIKLLFKREALFVNNNENESYIYKRKTNEDLRYLFLFLKNSFKILLSKNKLKKRYLKTLKLLTSKESWIEVFEK